MKKWFITLLSLFVIPVLAFATQANKSKASKATKDPASRTAPARRAPARTAPARRVPTKKATVATAPAVRRAPARRAPAKKAKKPAKPLYDIDSPVYQAPARSTSLGRILHNQGIRVCVRTDVPPFGYFSQQGLTGFDIALAKELSTQLSIFYKKNLTITWVTINAKARISSLQNNQCDFVAAALSYTKARAKKIAYTKRYLKTDKVILSYANITRKAPVIALLRGTTNSAKGLKGKSRFFNSYKEIIFAMEAGEIDYVVTDRPIALHLMRSVTRRFLVVKSLPSSEIYGIGVNKNDKHLLRALNSALRALALSGRLAYLHRQWL